MDGTTTSHDVEIRSSPRQATGLDLNNNAKLARRSPSLFNSPIVFKSFSMIHQVLLNLGLSEEHIPSVESLAWNSLLLSISYMYYYYQSKRIKELRYELRESQEKLRYLQDKILEPSVSGGLNLAFLPRKPIRIFMDGAFDLLHFGHMNAFRLGRSLGSELIVGVNSDESITECKGAPLMNDHERLTMVSACKFVDEVIPGCPYIMNEKYLDYVIEKYNIDYVVHGDDPCIVDGKDVYEAAKKAGKYRSIPRTEGVSTTDIMGRMLLLTKEHHRHDRIDSERSISIAEDESTTEQASRTSNFLTTSRMLQLFTAGRKAASPEMRIVYTDGAWDLFHPGHVAMLKAAKEQGDYLIVGIHGDSLVNKIRGMNLPLMNLHERVLSVLGCRYVDDVLIDAPYTPNKSMFATLNISKVVVRANSTTSIVTDNENNRFSEAAAAGILCYVNVPATYDVNSVVQRIQRNQEMFQARFDRKKLAENEFTQAKRTKK